MRIFTKVVENFNLLWQVLPVLMTMHAGEGINIIFTWAIPNHMTYYLPVLMNMHIRSATAHSLKQPTNLDIFKVIPNRDPKLHMIQYCQSSKIENFYV